MNSYDEKMAPLFSQILGQREFEQHEILREASERWRTDTTALARPAAEYARFERAARELKALWKARRRIADKSFGKCEECGNGIDLLRLNASPVTTICLPCEHKNSRRSQKGGN